MNFKPGTTDEQRIPIAIGTDIYSPPERTIRYGQASASVEASTVSGWHFPNNCRHYAELFNGISHLLPAFQ